MYLGKKLLTALFTFTCLSCVVIPPDASDKEQVSSCDTSDAVYQLIWSDEFSGSTLDSTKWTHETGYGSWGWGNDEWQYYNTNSTSVSSGNLKITANSSGTAGKRNGTVTSARIITKNKFSFKYGKIEARMKVPLENGLWPAFWMLGSNIDTVSWPNCGEIDILEMFNTYGSNNRTANFAVHWSNATEVCNGCGSREYTSDKHVAASSLTTGYHVYSAVWTPCSINGYIDDQLYFSLSINTPDKTEFHEPFFILLNIAVGGTLGGTTITSNWPQEMLVDYVRVYQQSGS